MTDVARLFIEQSRHLLRDDYLPKIRRCVGELTDDDIWWRPHESSNSIGNLLLHLRGNVTQWMLGGVGRRTVTRRRQLEFDERAPRPASELLAALTETMGEVDDVLAALDPASLLESREIQTYHVTVFEAIYHVVEHFSMHTGQIILVAKQRTGRDLTLWRPPSPAALE